VIADVIIPARGCDGWSAVGHAVTLSRMSRARAVYVSTDDDGVAGLADVAGATGVFRRPAGLSGGCDAAVELALRQMRVSEMGTNVPDIVLMVQCSCRTLTTEDIDACISALEAGNCESVFSAAPFSGYVWAESGNQVVPVNHPGRVRLRKVDCDTQWIETGGVYGFRVDEFLRTGSRFCGRTLAVPAKEADHG